MNYDPIHSTIELPQPSPHPPRTARIDDKFRHKDGRFMLKVKGSNSEIFYYTVSKEEYSRASIGSDVEFHDTYPPRKTNGTINHT